MALKIVASYEAPRHCEIYTLYQKVHFEITSLGTLTPDQGNPLIEKLFQALKTYVYEEGTVKATIIDVDEFECRQENTKLAKGLWELVRWHVFDKDPDESRRVYRFNNEIKGLLYSLLMKLKFSHYNATIKVVLDQGGGRY